MTDTTLAQLSNTAVYSAMVVLTLAMLAYAVYLARLLPAREAATAARPPRTASWSPRVRWRAGTRHPVRRQPRPRRTAPNGTTAGRSRSPPARPPASRGC